MGAALRRVRNDTNIGMYEDICVRCAESLHASQRSQSVGKLTGKKIYVGRTLNGSKFCICDECIKEISKQI